ncbi:MAG: class I SAM-dependent methyltransferase [Actinomycetes bacterium]
MLAMSQDPWSTLADRYDDEASASVKGKVRNYVLHHHLLDHLPQPPAAILDVGGGAAHQALPLARAGYEVTLLDSSPAMLGKAERRLGSEPAAVRARVRLVHGRGEDAGQATGGARFSAVLCHGVLMYLDQPQPLVTSLCECVAPGGVVSVMALNAQSLAVLPALQRRWSDALAAFDARIERGVLGVRTRADTVGELSDLLRARGVEPEAWYGVWLFADLVNLTDAAAEEISQIAAVELQASRRDPYRHLSRVFHLVGRRHAA